MGEFGGRSHFSRIVLLGNLQGAVTEEELKRVFEKHGMVDEVISRDDYALIIMQDEDSVSKAVNALNDSTVWIQCKLKVAPLRERRNGGGNSDDGYGGSGHDRRRDGADCWWNSRPFPIRLPIREDVHENFSTHWSSENNPDRGASAKSCQLAKLSSSHRLDPGAR